MPKLTYEVNVAVQETDMLGECPMWHPSEQTLYWVDTRRPALRKLEEDGSVRTWQLPVNIGSFVFRRDGNLIVALKTGFHHMNLSTGELTLIVDPEPRLPENRLNDGRCDFQGRFWCGSRDPSNDNPGGSLYRLDPDGSVHRMDTGIIVANGTAITPEGDTLFFGDSRGETVWRYDLDTATGTLSNKRVYLQTEGLPWRIDGATCDSQGNYWCALVGGGAVGCFDAQGRLIRMITLPVSHPTMCNFGGPDMDILYVTSSSVLVPDDEREQQPLAGSVFAIRGLGVHGTPEPFFGA